MNLIQLHKRICSSGTTEFIRWGREELRQTLRQTFMPTTLSKAACSLLESFLQLQQESQERKRHGPPVSILDAVRRKSPEPSKKLQEQSGLRRHLKTSKKAYTKISNDLKLKLPPETAESYIPRFAAHVGYDRRTMSKALRIAKPLQNKLYPTTAISIAAVCPPTSSDRNSNPSLSPRTLPGVHRRLRGQS